MQTTIRKRWVIKLKNNSNFQRHATPQYVTIKIDNNEYREQLSLMIKQASQLQIVSESIDEIVIISKHQKKLVNDLFPRIKTIESELTLFESKRKKLLNSINKNFLHSTKMDRQLEIINISGVLIKKMKCNHFR